MSFSGVPSTTSAYLAGIVDGEGWIGVGKKQGGTNFYCRLSVGMTELISVTLLQTTFGGSIREEKRQGLRSIYRWYCTKNAETYSALKVLRPFLLIKGKQADLVMSFIETNPTPNGGKQTQQELERRASIYAAAKKLNAVGKAALQTTET